jgi:hypothetical protein
MEKGKFGEAVGRKVDDADRRLIRGDGEGCVSVTLIP